MPYSKTTWTDRAVQKPFTYTMQDNGDGTFTLTPAPGTITQAGTPINAFNLNKVEQGIADALPKDGSQSMTGPLTVLTAGLIGRQVNANSWTDVSSNTNGYSLFANNAYTEGANVYKYANTHGSLGARGIRVSSAGIEYFDTGAIATTAGLAFTPTFVKIWHASNDGSGSGADADLLDGRQGANYAVSNDKLTPLQLQNMNLPSGIYTNDGQGLLKSNGAAFVSTGWYHVYHSYHGSDGYAMQMAFPYGHENNQSAYWRNATGTTWKEWRSLGGSTDIQPTYERFASVANGNATRTVRTWYTIVDIQNKKGMIMAAWVYGHGGFYDNGGNTWTVDGNIQVRITIDDQVETPIVGFGGYGMGDYLEGYGYGLYAVRDTYMYGGDGGANRGAQRQDPIYFGRNFKMEAYIDITKAGYTTNPVSIVSNGVRYALHVGQ